MNYVLTAIESECDHALQCAKLLAHYQRQAAEHPIGRRACAYQVGRFKKLIVASAIRVEIWRQRQLDLGLVRS